MRFFICTLFCLLVAQNAFAEEGGGGAYYPGSIASVIDSMLPNKGTAIIRANLYNYDGRNDIGCLDSPCSASAIADVSSKALSLTLGWRPNIHISDNWSYMMSTAIPYVRMNVKTRVTSGSSTAIAEDTKVGLGDIELAPLNFSYHMDEENQINLKGTVRAPTGKYSVNHLTNIGKNYWSYEPSVGFIHVNKDHSRHFTVYSGVNFNTKNKATGYKSGTQAHVEFTAEQRMPSMSRKGTIGLGLTGYAYYQLEDDEQHGAKIDDSKARSHGIGPVLSYTGLLGNEFSVVELKWIHDFASKNRFEGDTVLLKAGVIF